MKQFILILQLLPNLSWALNVKHFAESEERMFIINTETGQTEKFLVAHGRNSGDLYAEKFSNEENSKMSSLGYYLIEEKY